MTKVCLVEVRRKIIVVDNITDYPRELVDIDDVINKILYVTSDPLYDTDYKKMLLEGVLENLIRSIIQVQCIELR